MNEIIDALKKKIEALNNGELSLDELNEATELSRELYERLIVLNHKAKEKYVQEEVVEEVQEEISEPIVEEPEPEVEEVVQEEVEESTPEPVEEQPAFDFTLNMEEEVTPASDLDIIKKEEAQTVEPVAEEVEEEPVEEIIEEEVSVEEPAEEIHSESEVHAHISDETDQTLKEQLGQDDPLSLRKKLQSTPVEDLYKEISIAKKFEYIEIMFGGNESAYESAIETLNSCSGVDEAQIKINEYSSTNNWDLENKSIIKFVELVERRYL